MATDEERRKMAQKLRKYASWDEDGELVGCTEFGESVLNLLSCGDTERECFNALADLIEPEPERTCRDTSPLVYKFTCSECHSSYRFGCEHVVWYCPFCGAKVVGNDWRF